VSVALQFAIIGIATGALYVLMALGLVIVHRGSGVVNFAHGAIGMVGTFIFWEAWANWHWAYGFAFVVGVLTAGAIGLVFHLAVMRPLRNSPVLTRVIATLALLTILEQAATKLYTGQSIIVPSELPTSTVSVFGATVGVNLLYLLAAALILSLVLGVVYRSTQFGRATTAVRENRRAISALGWSPDKIASSNWFIGSALAGVAGILLAPIETLSITGYTLLVVPALAAAVVGQLASFPMTLLGGVVVGVAQAEVNRYISSPGWSDAMPFLLMIAFLIIRGNDRSFRTAIAQRLPSLGSGRIRWPVVLGWLVAAFILIETIPASWNDAVTTTVGTGLVILSVIVVTGYSGQLSLAQFAFAGWGAWIAGALAADYRWPFLLAIIVGALAAVPLGAVVGIVCLRTRGVNLAIATLGMAVALDSLIFSNPERTQNGQFNLPEPKVFGLDVGSISYPDRYAIVVVVAFAICAIATANMRRGRSGRRLVSIRSNERAAASLGIPVVQAKLVAFAISSGIAALGGALLAFRDPYITFTGSYDASLSITLVGFGVVGGVGWLAGALYGGLLQVGSLASAVLDELGSTVSSWLPLAGGVLLLIVLLTAPDGMAAEGLKHVQGLVRLVVRRPKGAARLPDLTVEHGHRVDGRTLQLDNISISFGGVRAVSEVSLTVRPGEIVGLIGPNGAGKTTLIDAATGFVQVNSGSIRIGETNVTRQSPAARTRAGLSRSFQSLELFDDLTVLDNLRAASDQRDVKAFVLDALHPTTASLTPATRAAIASFGLEPHLMSKPTELPYGVRRLVAIARTVATNASIVALDEPAAGLDANESRELGELLRAIATDSGMGVLLVEHNVELVMGLCDRVYALEFGKLIAEGTPAEVRSNPAVIHSYLGVDQSAAAGVPSAISLPNSRA
jgi:sulfate-transporting ATPase